MIGAAVSASPVFALRPDTSPAQSWTSSRSRKHGEAKPEPISSTLVPPTLRFSERVVRFPRKVDRGVVFLVDWGNDEWGRQAGQHSLALRRGNEVRPPRSFDAGADADRVKGFSRVEARPSAGGLLLFVDTLRYIVSPGDAACAGFTEDGYGNCVGTGHCFSGSADYARQDLVEWLFGGEDGTERLDRFGDCEQSIQRVGGSALVDIARPSSRSGATVPHSRLYAKFEAATVKEVAATSRGRPHQHGF